MACVIKKVAGDKIPYFLKIHARSMRITAAGRHQEGLPNHAFRRDLE
jgi:hypothetical protein